MSAITFKRDTSFRKELFTSDHFAHPAKMDAQLLIWIVEHYTKPGETILDPMAGCGTTMLACISGRNAILVELEQKFVDMQKANWNKVRMMPQLGCQMGECQIIQGDARNLGNVLVDHAIFSPPYENVDKIGREYGGIVAREVAKGNTKGNLGQAQIYSRDGGNIGNLKAESYLSAMLQVYQQCHSVLRPGGLLILITKNFIRNKKEVRLDEDTMKLCDQAGFQFVERHYRKLPAQSFWRVIYRQKYPDAPVLDKEDILVFVRKQP